MDVTGFAIPPGMDGAGTDRLTVSEQNFKAFFDNSINFLFVLDERANIITANRTVIERLGYEREELFGQTVLTVHPPELRDEAARITGAMLAGEADVCPLPLQTKAGCLIPVETRVIGNVTWNGRPALFGISTDISDLRLSEQQFSEIFKGSPTMMSIADEESGRILDVNRSFLTTLGYTSIEVVGRTAEELDLFEYAFQYSTVWEGVGRGGVSNASMMVQTKTGLKLECVLNVHRIQVQEAPRLILEIQDVSRLMKVRRELAESEKRLERVLDASGVGSWDWDFVTSTVHFDARWCSMLGYERFELPGTLETWERLVHPEDYPHVMEVLQAHLDGKTDAYETEHRLQAKNGEWRWILDRGRVVSRRVDGAPLRMSGSHLDITDRKRAEEALHARERLLEGLAHATTELLAGSRIEEHRIASALRGLGEAAGVDRVYIFENTPGEPGTRGFCHQRYEWSHDSVEPQIDNPDLQDVPWDMGFARWYDAFQAGDYISGDIAMFPEDERPPLEAQDIVSLLALPIHSHGSVWGFMGFDVCSEPRIWSDSEIAMLKAAANAFGVAIELERCVAQAV